MVFLDGDHFADAVHADLRLIRRYLAPNGLIILHDVGYDWSYEVLGGVRQFMEEISDACLSIDDNLAFLELREA